MPGLFRKVCKPFYMRARGQQVHELAEKGEILQEVTEIETTDSPNEVAVFRIENEESTSYIVSRAELEANTEII